MPGIYSELAQITADGAPWIWNLADISRSETASGFLPRGGASSPDRHCGRKNFRRMVRKETVVRRRDISNLLRSANYDMLVRIFYKGS